jgi:hypothetical protein
MGEPGFRYKVLDEETAYTGRELRSGWVRSRTGFSGDAAAGFIGPCHVATEDLVDLDDAAAGEFIRAASMAHVIVEHQGRDLEKAVLRQRLLVSVLCDILGEKGLCVRRSGDDVFSGVRKLTVSIAAPGPASTLIHLGINIDPGGAPVPAVGLREMGVEPVGLLRDLLERYGREFESIRYATGKVRPVP